MCKHNAEKMVNEDASFANKNEEETQEVEKTPETLHSSLSESLFRSGTRRKRAKSVSFADTRGLKLEEVKPKL